MMNCWSKLPDERLPFSNVVLTLSNYTELIAGYLDISNYNPFESMYASIGSNAAAAEPSNNDRYTTIATCASTERLVHNSDSGSNITNSDDSDKKKQRSLSKSSQCASPQASPTASSGGIEIRIQSPLEDEKRMLKF